MINISKFEELLKFNINDKVEKKKSGNTELTYLSWAFAVGEMEKAYPEWEYSILEFNGLPYQFDPNTGYLVWTEIKAGGKTKRMWLPVMDGSNKAMKDKPYEYTTKFGKKSVEVASMFDINKTIMRCLVKNIAMFGLGLYIYAGEDLPEGEQEQSENKDAIQQTVEEWQNSQEGKKWIVDNFKLIKDQVEACESLDQLKQVWAEKSVDVARLKRYALAQYDLLVGSKEYMKDAFDKTKEMDEASNV